MSDRGPEGGSVTMARRGGVATVTLANPGRRNALTWPMYEQLETITGKLAGQGELRVVVFRGNREDGFAAGTEISQFRGFTGADGLAYERRVGRVLAGIAKLPVPTIAAVQRTAIGAGLAIVAACDLVVAEHGARFGVPIAGTLGNGLPAAVVAGLRRKLGPGHAAAMLLAARTLTAEQLSATGFVTTISPAEEFEADLAETVDHVAGLAPLTLRSLKETIRRLDAQDSSPVEDADLLEGCYGSADFREGVHAFLEHRPPRWKGI